MNHIICHQHDRVGNWVMSRCNSEWHPVKGVTLGLEDSNGDLLAGAIFENYNGTNLFIHAAARSGSLTEEFLHVCFHYCFIKNHCRRISCVVDESNTACQRFVQRVGWTEEFRMIGAGILGGDLIVFKMTPETCKWLSEDERNGLI